MKVDAHRLTLLKLVAQLNILCMAVNAFISLPQTRITEGHYVYHAMMYFSAIPIAIEISIATLAI